LILGSKPSKAIMDGNNCFASAFVHWPQDSKRFVLVIVKTSSKRGTIATLEHRLIDESDPVVLSLSHKKQQYVSHISKRSSKAAIIIIIDWFVSQKPWEHCRKGRPDDARSDPKLEGCSNSHTYYLFCLKVISVFKGCIARKSLRGPGYLF